MNKNTNALYIMPALLLCCLTGSRSFAGEKRKLVIDQSLISKRRKLEQAEVTVCQPKALTVPFAGAVISSDPCDVLNRLTITHNMHHYVQEISEGIFQKTEQHMKYLDKSFKNLEKLYGGITPADIRKKHDVRKKMAEAVHNYRVARQMHAQGNCGEALLFCSKVLAVKTLETTPDPHMTIEDL